MKTDDACVGWDGMDRRTRVGFVWKFRIYWGPGGRGERDVTSRLRGRTRVRFVCGRSERIGMFADDG
jgi:hypothetical protein